MEKIEQIVENMREPRVKDIRALSHLKSEEEKEFTLLSNLTGQTPEELDNLTFKEYKLLQDKLKSFLS